MTATAMIRRSTVGLVTLVGVGILLATAYLSPFVGNASLGARGLPKTATDSSVPPKTATDSSVAPKTAAHSSVPPKTATDSSVPPKTAAHSSVTEEIRITDQTNSPQGYFMARYYEQQMMQDTKNFFELSNIAVRLNMSMVEPFVQGTHLIGIPHIKPLREDKTFWELSMFYDLDHLHAALNTCSSSCQLVSFETVLENAPHNVVLVYFLVGSFNSFKDYFPGRKYPNIVELDHKKVTSNRKVKQTLTVLNTCMKYFSKLMQKQLPQFHHPRVLLADARPFHSLSLSAVTEEIGSIVSEEANKSGPVMVIIDQWRGCSTGNQSRYFYYVPDFHYPGCGEQSINHSKAVIEATHDFSESLNQTRPVISVHIRGERLLESTKGNYSHCMRQLTTCLQTLTTTNKIPSERVYVIHDLGSYGTTGCYEYCARGRSKLLSQINTLGYPVISYDPTMFKSFPVSPAFAAFVEQEYLANVDILVTVGGGSFEQSIIQRFLKKSGSDKNNLYKICFLA